MIGIALTASKSAIVIYMLLLCLLYIKKPKYIIPAVVVVLVAYHVGLFDLVLDRFTGSLSTGRNEKWEILSDSGVTFFHWFWGNGSDSKYAYEYITSWARAAFEYPVRLFALEFGIIFCALIMFIAFAYPLYQLLKRNRNWPLIIVYAAVVAHVNMYNGIGTYGDQMYMYALFGCGILAIDRIAKGVDEEVTIS